MTNEKLVKLYNTLTSPSESLGGKSFYSADALGGSAEAFASKLQEKGKLEKLYTTLTSPSESLGGKSFYSADALGGSIDAFSSKIGIQKKSPIGNVSTNGSNPSQGTDKGTFPFISPTVKPSTQDDWMLTSEEKDKATKGVKSDVFSKLEIDQRTLVGKDKEMLPYKKRDAQLGALGNKIPFASTAMAEAKKINEPLIKERGFLKNNVVNSIGKAKPEIDKLIDNTFENEGIDSFIETNLSKDKVSNASKIADWADKTSIYLGVGKDSYVRDLLVRDMTAKVNYKIIEPKIKEKAKELYKKQNGKSFDEEVGAEYEKGLSSLQKIKTEAELKASQVDLDIKIGFKVDLEKLSTTYNEPLKVMSENYKTKALEINSIAEELTRQYQGGVLQKNVYEAEFGKLKSGLDALSNEYQTAFSATADQFVKSQHELATKYNFRYKRHIDEINALAKTEAEKIIAKNKAEYNISPTLQRKYSKAWEGAVKWQELSSEADLTYKSKLKASGIGGVEAYFFENFTKGLGGGVKSISEFADFDYGKEFGSYLEGLYSLPSTEIKKMSDLLDPMKFIGSAGSTIGGMAPMIAGQAILAPLTGGSSVVTQLAVQGGFGFMMETAQMAGDMHDRVMNETGIEADANLAAGKVIQGNSLLLPLYALDGLPFIEGATLGIKNRLLRGLAKGGIETLTEIPQEFSQSAIEETAFKGEDLSKALDRVNIFTNPAARKSLEYTTINVLPSTLIMGSFPTFAGYAKKPYDYARGRTSSIKMDLKELSESARNQFLHDTYLRRGETFTKAMLSGMYSAGFIDEMQLIKMTDVVAMAAKVSEEAKTNKLNFAQTRVYGALAMSYNKAKSEFESLEDGVAKKAAGIRMRTAEAAASNFLATKRGEYGTLIMPNGEQYVYSLPDLLDSLESDNYLQRLIKQNKLRIKLTAIEGSKIATSIQDIINPITEEAEATPLDESIDESIDIVDENGDPTVDQDVLDMQNERNALITDLKTEAQPIVAEKEDGKPLPISSRAGESVTVNIGGRNVTGLVYVDEGGKATIESNNTIYEIPENAQYVEYSSPISATETGIEYAGQIFDDIRIETFNGVERAILIDSGINGEKGKVRTITNPTIVEEIKYALALKELETMSDEEGQQILDDYETRNQEEAATATQEVPSGESKTDASSEIVDQALADIDLIEQIAFEELAQSENAAKLVEMKVSNKVQVYLVSKNADGSYSASLNGRNVKRAEFLAKLGEAFEEQTKKESDALVEKLQAQINDLKAEVEEKLFGIKKEKEDATKKSTKQEQEGGKQSSKPKRERIKAVRNEAKKSKADSSDSSVGGKKGQEITNINAKFVKVSELYDSAQEAESPSQKTTINRKLNAFLNANPGIKYIYENMNELNKQLGDRMDKSKGCP